VRSDPTAVADNSDTGWRPGRTGSEKQEFGGGDGAMGDHLPQTARKAMSAIANPKVRPQLMTAGSGVDSLELCFVP
jgi:hypothetical protein